ncbi:MAG: GrpB family protein, partial [Chitinispirillaceae bacterium]
LTILKSIDDRPSEMIELPIEWRWKKNVFLHGQKWEVGDFSIPQFFAPELLGRPARADFWISFNLFEDAQKEYVNGDQIQLAEYDPTWSRQYQKFSRWLKSYFGSDIIRRTEHFGSTAIPGIWAKPIVDILAEVPSFSRARERMLPKLTEEWEYCWYSNHMMLIKRDSFMGKRVLHVHLAPRDHDMWERLSFRDYLRSHPKEAAEYSRLKRQIVTQYSDDRERYTWSKGEFVRAVTRKALEWEGRNRQD